MKRAFKVKVGGGVRLREINHLKDWSGTFLTDTCAFTLCLTHSTYRKKIYYILDVTQCNKNVFYRESRW